MSSSVLYQITEVDPTSPLTEGKVYQVHKVTAEEAPFIGGKTYNAIMIKDPDDPLVSGKVYQATFIADPTDPTVKGKVYNAIVEGDSEIVIIGPAVSPLSLPDAIANSLEYVKAFGGTEQRNLPAGYTELEYIESTGIVSGLYTGVQWKDVSKIEILYQIISRASTGNIVFASLSTEPSGVVSAVEPPYVAYRNSDTGPIFYNISGTASPNYSATELTGGGLKGITYTFAADSIAKYVWFGSWSDSFYTPTYQCGCVKIYDTNDEIIRNYVPAKRNSDNVVGMYDTVSGTFFTNAGTGSFTAGPDVTPTPDTPMDIISNNGVVKVSLNLCNNVFEQGSIAQDGSDTGGSEVTSRIRLKNFITLPAGTYSISCDSTYEIYLYTSGSASRWVQTDTFTFSSTGQVRFAVRNKATPTADVSPTAAVNVMLNAGSSALPYTPYSATGVYTDGTVETINVHGKNLYNSATSIPNVILTDTGSTINAGGALVSDYILVMPNTTYTLKFTRTDESVYTRVCSYSSANESDFLSLLVKDTSVAAGDVTATFTTDATAKYIRVSFKADSTNIQLEQGSTATAYEPYFDGGTATAEMLLKVGNYQDEQEILSGAITRNVGVKVFDGTENWALGVTGRYYLNITPAYAKAQYTPLCSHFQMYLEPGGTADMTTPDTLALYTGGVNTYQIYAYPSTTIANSLAAWKQWLANQYNAGTPVTIVYPLATPTTESVAGQAMQVQAGDNTLEITQASLDNLELEAKYSKEA